MPNLVSTTSVPDSATLIAVALFTEDLAAANLFGIQADWLTRPGFEAKAGTNYSAVVDGKNVLLIGLGSREEAEIDGIRRAAASAARAASGHVEAAFVAPFDHVGWAKAAAEGALLGTYKYTELKSKVDEPKLQTISLIGAEEAEVTAGVRVAVAVAKARDLVNAPAGVATPSRLAQVATEVAAAENLDLVIWDENDIERERLGGLRGVSMGSDEPPRFIKLTYTPAGTPTATLALVGKGITFDSGGLSLKPAAGMMTMKTDMSGAAAVISAMSVIGATRPKAKVIAYALATENLPGPKATKPGDVLTARNGKTMEVLNTDAEGRLVLSDGLSLAVEDEVDAIIDLATLTGACVVALGSEIAGLMTNNDEFGARVQAAADKAGEAVWKLPLPKRYRKHIDSDVADIKNTGAAGGYAGALSAALFLQEFVGDTPWVHLDIAGPARADGDDAYITKGGTGFGVRTLIELVDSYS